MKTVKQQTLRLSRRPASAQAEPVDLSRADFGSDFEHFNYPLPVQHRPEGGFAYRYGRPANKVTVGMPLEIRACHVSVGLLKSASTRQL